MLGDENRLITRAQNGDTRAFEQLVAAHAPYVYNLALRVVRDPHHAEDISQEAFVRVWHALPGFRADARFRTWLYRIVTNLCYSRLPALKRDILMLDGDAALAVEDSRQRVERQVGSNELSERLAEAVDALPDSYRLLITLRHVQQLSYDEIADVTGMPLGTVKTGIYRARRELRNMLEPYVTGVE